MARSDSWCLSLVSESLGDLNGLGSKIDLHFLFSFCLKDVSMFLLLDWVLAWVELRLY